MQFLPPNRVIEENYLYEGLIYTHDIDLSLSQLLQRNSNQNVAFFKFSGNGSLKKENRIGMLLLNTLPEKECLNTLKTLNSLGWLPSYYYSKGTLTQKYKYNENEFINFYKNNFKTILVFDAKFDLEYVDANNSQYLYHITPIKYKDKILKIGLAPKSKSKIATHPHRIYLCDDYNLTIDLLNDSHFYPEEKTFVVFKIKLKELLKRRSIRFFQDPAYKQGLYTYENIPPNYIEIINQIER